MSEMKRLARLVLLSASVISVPVVYAADFTFNFNINPDGRAIQGGVNGTGSTFGGNDKSRFYQAVVDVGGVQYFQTIVGHPGTGFAIESYTTALYASSVGSTAAFRPYSLDVGGNERALIGTQAQVGTSQNQINAIPGKLIGNAKDPFGTTVSEASGFQPYDLSGNGTGSPDRMTMRMLLSSGDITQEIFKPLLTRKPRLEQKVMDGNATSTMSSDFVADMRSLTYDSKDRSVSLVNRVAITDLSTGEDAIPTPGAGDFDMTMAQNSVSNAGRFSFARGTGWNNPLRGWDVDGSTFGEGSYTYVGSNFDVFSADWASFFSASQNAVYCATFNRKSSVCP